MQLAGNVAQQVETWQTMVFRTLTEQNLIIEQMLDPYLFGNDISNFPVSWSDAQPVTWTDIEEQDPDSIEKYGNKKSQLISKKYLTYL